MVSLHSSWAAADTDSSVGDPGIAGGNGLQRQRHEGSKRGKLGRNQTQKQEQLELGTVAVKAVVSILCDHAKHLLCDDERRHSLRLGCSARVQIEAWAGARYGEQAILANLDWGIDGVESAARKEEGGVEARLARLKYAERMLGVAAVLQSEGVNDESICGVSNAYLAAWAHLYLALASKIRGDDLSCASHLLQVFIICPSYARLEFAPEIWQRFFLPQLSAPKAGYHRDAADVCSHAAASAPGWRRQETRRVAEEACERAGEETRCAEERSVRDSNEDRMDGRTRRYAEYYKKWLRYDMLRGSEGRRGSSSSCSSMKEMEPPETPAVSPSFCYDHDRQTKQKKKRKKRKESKSSSSSNNSHALSTHEGEDDDSRLCS